MANIYICQIGKTDINIDLRFDIIADNIEDAVHKSKREFIDIIGTKTLNRIIRRFESYYDAERSNIGERPIIRIIDTSSFKPVDIDYLDNKVAKLRGKEFKQDVSDIVKDLVLYESYYISIFSNSDLIERYEAIYNDNIELEEFRRELSDYTHKYKNKFDFESKVRLKNLNNGIVYIVTSTPYPTFNSRYWENIYGITQQGYEDMDDGINYELSVHESELEKVEEE